MRSVTCILLISTCLLVTPSAGIAQAEGLSEKIDKKNFDPATLLWHQAPADQWENALPVGNGRLGAMVYGGVEEERIQLNDDTYWSGGPYSTVVEGGYEYLPEIQKLLFDGEPLKAHKLFSRHLMGYPIEQMKYQSMGALHLFFEKDRQFSDYKRWLDLSTGITGSSYVINGVTYTREVLSSHPDQVIAIRLTASEPGMISFEAEMRGSRNVEHSNYGTDYFWMDGEDGNELVLRGRSADYLGIESKMLYEGRARFENEGGHISMDDSWIKVENADAATIYYVAATNFVNYKDVSADQAQRVQNYFRNLGDKKYGAVRRDAVEDHQALFERVKLDLTTTPSCFLPTDERLRSIQVTPDPQMAALSYQFGRYLLIASSRPGTQPANLQGIWNDYPNPMWDSKYTTNINTEMNYWAVESANLSELSAPLFKMIEELTDQGTQVAREHYGAGGWVFHQNTDIWRVAAPMDGPTWGTFTVGGAWLTTHMWEHYLYTQDEKSPEEVYPILKGSVDFFMDFLVPHPNGKWMVTAPSNSPENPPKGPGYRYFFDEVIGRDYFTTIVYGSSIDMQIIDDLFKYYGEAAAILRKDPAFASRVEQTRKRLVPPQVGKDGTLQEWAEDYAQMEDKHRHFSHLYGLYPGNVLSVKKTPEFVEPVKKVLEQRGDGSTGWSRAWKIALWSRLYDGERAFSIYKGHLKEQCYISLFAKCGTPLQVDGSFGLTAAITEMIVQSHEGVIDLLPAIPAEWSTGQFDGVRVRGGFELNMAWKDQQITSIEIISKAGKTCRIDAGDGYKVTKGGKDVPAKTHGDGSIEFDTIEGGTYLLTKQG